MPLLLGSVMVVARDGKILFHHKEKEYGQIAEGFYADFVAVDRDFVDEVSVPEEQIWQTAVLSTWTGGVAAWEHSCWKERAAMTAPAWSGTTRLAERGLNALRECVEAERAKAPPLTESMLERFQRLSAAHGDGCPF